MIDYNHDYLNLLKRIQSLENRVGVNDQNIHNGNGLIQDYKDIETVIERFNLEASDRFIMLKELGLKMDSISNDIADLYREMSNIENQLKDNITVKTFAGWRNIIVGAAAVLVAFATIGTFLYKFLSLIFKQGE